MNLELVIQGVDGMSEDMIRQFVNKAMGREVDFTNLRKAKPQALLTLHTEAGAAEVREKSDGLMNTAEGRPDLSI